jgi:anti-sigma B factor antagonist
MSGPYFDLRIDYSKRHIAMHGEFDIATASCLATALTGLQRSADGDITIGLEDVTFIDASGLGALTGARFAQQDRGHNLTGTGASEQVTRLITMSGLAGLLDDDAADHGRC